MIRSLLLILLLALPASAAVEDFTTWTEVDAGGHLSVSASSVTGTNVPNNAGCHVYKDFGAGHFTDFEVRFKFNGGESPNPGSWSNSPHLGLICLSNAVGDAETIKNSHQVHVGWTRGPGGPQYVIFIKQGPSQTETAAEGLGLVTPGVEYFCTFSRDYDGGANGTGLYTLYVCTGNYYGQAGSTTVDSKTLTSPAGEQAAFRYALTAQAKGSGSSSYTASGTISNMDLGEEDGSPPDPEPDPEPEPEAPAPPVIEGWQKTPPWQKQPAWSRPVWTKRFIGRIQ